jgi:uncharacterized RDD family membrane protein YckC
MIYAGFFRRLLAYLIDALVVAALQIGLFAAAIPVLSSDPKVNASSLAVRSAATWAYFALMESSPLQATLGKLALGIRVEHEQGGPLTFRRASMRYWLKILSSLTLMIGWLMAAFTPRRQALHDLMVHSVVVRTDVIEQTSAEHWDPAVPLLAEHWDGTRWVSGPRV